jgi:hypothetical protein
MSTIDQQKIDQQKKIIISHLLDDDDFERLKEMREDDNIYNNMSYDEFVDWNSKKIDALNMNEMKWLYMLLTYMASEKINLIDMEDCGSWTATAFFYHMDGKLCITHPR